MISCCQTNSSEPAPASFECPWEGFEVANGLLRISWVGQWICRVLTPISLWWTAKIAGLQFARHPVPSGIKHGWLSGQFFSSMTIPSKRTFSSGLSELAMLSKDSVCWVTSPLFCWSLTSDRWKTSSQPNYLTWSSKTWASARSGALMACSSVATRLREMWRIFFPLGNMFWSWKNKLGKNKDVLLGSLGGVHQGSYLGKINGKKQLNK